jgi:hypothetical protein
MKKVFLFLFVALSSIVSVMAADILPPNIPVLNSVTNITTSSVTINWTSAPLSGCTNVVEYRKTPNMTWTTKSGASPTVITGLLSGTPYQVRIKTVCGSTMSYSSNQPYFTTTGSSSGGSGGTTTCAPINLSQTISGSHYTLTWADCDDAGTNKSYGVQYTTGGTWLTAFVAAGSKTTTINPNAPLTNWKVREISPNVSAYSYYLTSSGARLMDNTVKSTEGLSIYPNPTTGLLSLQNLAAAKSIVITDLMGKQLLQIPTNGDTVLDISLTEYPTGIYFLKTDNGQVQKIVKQ